MAVGRLVGSLVSGSVFALLTWLMIGDHTYIDLMGSRFRWLVKGIFILVFPGVLAGPMLSGNIHLVGISVAAIANFLFYFCLAYLG
jgi:hypothetical protein